MKKIKFIGTVKLKDGKCVDFNNIAEYNKFVTENYESIECTESKSEFISNTKDNIQDKEQNKQQDKRKLSTLITKTIELIKEDDASEKRCNTIGENLENVIETYISDNDIILDIDTCLNILNETSDNFQNTLHNSNEELKKLESLFNEKKDEVVNNSNRVKFMNALKNMCMKYASINNADEDNVKTEIIETRPQESFDFTEFPWSMLDDFDKDFSGKITGIKRFLNAIRNGE